MARKPVRFEMNPLLGGPSLDARNRSGVPYRELRLSEIDVDPDQPRRVFNEEGIRELASSIEEYGVLCPILVRVSAGGTYRIIAGERRFRACQQLGRETIPAIIDSAEDESSTTLGKQLVENLQRSDLSPMERALAVGQLRDQHGWSIREIGKRLGISKGLVQRSLEILQLPDDLQAALIAGAAETKVLALASLSDRESRKELLGRLNDLTRAEIEREVRDLLNAGVDPKTEAYRGGTGASAKSKRLSVEDQRIQDEIQSRLGLKVHLQRKSGEQGQGRLTVEFYSESDLQEVYRRLVD